MSFNLCDISHLLRNSIFSANHYTFANLLGARGVRRFPSDLNAIVLII
jgi:hypothetical protein